ncbi:UNVERIFIED_CONTAM: hypothetical protein ABID98_004395 [Brevibacillus sp. OAP136]
MMTREKAIFFETMQDLNIDGSLEPLFFAYHDFISGFDFSNVSDVVVHARAKECLKRYRPLCSNAEIDFYDMRWDILEKLDLQNAEWEYLDKKINQMEDAI